jgi:hypothetical protein
MLPYVAVWTDGIRQEFTKTDEAGEGKDEVDMRGGQNSVARAKAVRSGYEQRDAFEMCLASSMRKTPGVTHWYLQLNRDPVLSNLSDSSGVVGSFGGISKAHLIQCDAEGNLRVWMSSNVGPGRVIPREAVDAFWLKGPPACPTGILSQPSAEEINDYKNKNQRGFKSAGSAGSDQSSVASSSSAGILSGSGASSSATVSTTEVIIAARIAADGDDMMDTEVGETMPGLDEVRRTDIDEDDDEDDDGDDIEVGVQGGDFDLLGVLSEMFLSEDSDSDDEDYDLEDDERENGKDGDDADDMFVSEDISCIADASLAHTSSYEEEDTSAKKRKAREADQSNVKKGFKPANPSFKQGESRANGRKRKYSKFIDDGAVGRQEQDAYREAIMRTARPASSKNSFHCDRCRRPFVTLGGLQQHCQTGTCKPPKEPTLPLHERFVDALMSKVLHDSADGKSATEVSDIEPEAASEGDFSIPSEFIVSITLRKTQLFSPYGIVFRDPATVHRVVASVTPNSPAHKSLAIQPGMVLLSSDPVLPLDEFVVHRFCRRIPANPAPGFAVPGNDDNPNTKYTEQQENKILGLFLLEAKVKGYVMSKRQRVSLHYKPITA